VKSAPRPLSRRHSTILQGSVCGRNRENIEIGAEIHPASEKAIVKVDWAYLGKLVAANALTDDNINGIVQAHRGDLETALEKLADSMNSKDLRVTLVRP
jgi:hypothetical protein